MSEGEGVDDHDRLAGLLRALHTSTSCHLSHSSSGYKARAGEVRSGALEDEDCVRILKAIQSSPTLYYASIKFTGMSQSLVHELFHSLSSNRTIKSLHLYYYQPNEEVTTSVDILGPLSTLLTTNSCCLERLRLYFGATLMDLMSSGAGQLGPALGKNQSLISLNVIGSDHWSPETTEKVFGARGLGSNRTLQELLMEGMDLFSSGSVEHILRSNPSLRELTLYRCLFNWESVAAALEDNASVVNLELSPDFGVSGGDDRFTFLMRNSPLESMTFDCDKLGDGQQSASMHSLAAVVGINAPLKKLTLRGNNCSTAKRSLANLLKALATNKTLHACKFSFPRNSTSECVEEDLGEHAFDFLKQNSTLKVLGLRGDGLNDKDLYSLATSLPDNATLSFLGISNCNSFGEEGILNLLAALRHNRWLGSLSLEDCIGVAGDNVYKAFMDMLAANIWLKEVKLNGTPLMDDGSAARIKATLKRNVEVYSKEHLEVLKGMRVSRPKTARIFFCGNPRAGKTALQRSIRGLLSSFQPCTSSRPEKKSNFLFEFLKSQNCSGKGKDAQPLPPVEIERTHGIDVASIQWGDISLSIWDMAGHEDFQSFHDLVIPNLSGGGSSCVFLLVCNPYMENQLGDLSEKDSEVIKGELVFWLRLISSNTMRSTFSKRHVQIVFTREDIGSEPDEQIPRLQHILDAMQRRFDKVIILDQDYHMVDANSKVSIAPLVEALKQNVIQVLAQAPSIFDECLQMQKCIDNWNIKHPKEPLVKLDQFETICKSLMEGVNTRDQPQVVTKRLKAIAATLHNAGQIIHFEDHDFFVLNPRWFCHDIVGSIFDHTDVKGKGTKPFTEVGCTSKARMEVRLKKIIGVASFDTEDVLSLLMKLELCFESKMGSSDLIFLPSTLEDLDNKSQEGQRELHWQSVEKDSIHVGRRFKCKDEDCTVLTIGFFPRLQVALGKFYGRHNGEYANFTLKKNLIYFITDGMEILVEYSGQIGFDIDIMVQSTRTQTETIRFIHEELVPKIRDLIADPITGCQGVVLVEGILRSDVVKDLIMCKHRRNQVVMVADLKKVVLSRCKLDYKHSWEANPQCDLKVGFEYAHDLLGTNEWENVLRRRMRNLDELQQQHPWLFQSGVQLSTMAIDKMEPPFSVEPRDLWLDQRIDELKHQNEATISKLGEIQKQFGRIQKQLERIQEKQEEMHLQFSSKINALATFSKHLQQRSVPRIVYFTKEKASWRPKFRLIPGKRLCLRLMCENRGGVHVVPKQLGLLLTIRSDKQQQLETVLVYGLKVLTLMVKVGAHMTAGAGSMVPDLDKLFVASLDTPGVLDEQSSNNLIALREKVFASLDARDVTMSALDQAAEKWLVDILEPKRAQFHHYFGLHRVKYDDGEIAWVCEECRKELECL